jgi:hypothetical protein
MSQRFLMKSANQVKDTGRTGRLSFRRSTMVAGIPRSVVGEEDTEFEDGEEETGVDVTLLDYHERTEAKDRR